MDKFVPRAPGEAGVEDPDDDNVGSGDVATWQFACSILADRYVELDRKHRPYCIVLIRFGISCIIEDRI